MDAAVDDLMRGAYPWLLQRARCLERSEAQAWDLLQDTLERALQHLCRLKPDSNVRVWLFSIMFHLFVDRYRRRVRERLLDPGRLEGVAAPEPEPVVLWKAFGTEEIQSSLARLPEPFREVLDLHVNQRRSYDEIAEGLGIPASTVGTRLNRARHKMRALLLAPPTQQPS